MRSMTGFGQASEENQTYLVSVSARGVNHRYLDLKIRLETAYVASEAAVRDLFAQELRRGRVDVRVDIQRLGPRPVKVEVHRELLETLHKAVRQLGDEGLLTGGLQAGDLLRLPDALRIEAVGEAWGESDQDLLMGVASRALSQLVTARDQEGQVIAGVLQHRLDLLEEQVEVLKREREPAVSEIRDNLSRRLAELIEGTQLEPARFEQEVALLIERTDVQEELDRLAAHLQHFRSLMSGGESLGKRLDFLTQEILRELNTVGSKCRSTAMTRAVLEAKALCDQLREQVQNVE
ncbi:MAG: YicC family protein [Deltaproteobacteria bacterium]|nr:YicC family protein [Deltaproteobacteria bacterium]